MSSELGFFSSMELLKGRIIRIEEKIRNTEHVTELFFHGTKKIFVDFKTPTGNEELDVMNGGAVYLTDNIYAAAKYAGPDGYVCVCTSSNIVPYADQRARQGLNQKKARYTKGVYVASPEDIVVVCFVKVSDIPPQTRKERKKKKKSQSTFAS